MDDLWAAFPSFEKFYYRPSQPYALLGLQCAELLDEISECLAASKDPHGEVCALFAQGWRLEMAEAAALLCVEGYPAVSRDACRGGPGGAS